MDIEITTNNIYRKLLQRVLYPLLLYMPSYLDNFFKEKEEFSIYKSFFGHLLVTENKEYNFIADENSNLLFLLEKSKVLENNLFDLVDAKEILTEKQFEFLVDKYKYQLDAFTFISDILRKDIVSSENIVLKKHTSYIIHQATMFQEHQKNVEEHFSEAPKSDYNFVFKDLFIKRQETDGSKELLDYKPITSRPKAIKIPKITSKEADDYLLKTVFGLEV